MAISTAHSERDHALLSASGAKQWINCTPSVRLSEDVPETTSDEALEGTLAHELADVNLQQALGVIPAADADAQRAVLRQDKFYAPDMEGHVAVYTRHCREIYAEALADDPSAEFFLEQRTDFSHIVQEGFGTNDFAVASRRRLVVVDLKYGLGIRVFSHQNEQLMLYATGMIRELQARFGFQEVSLIIVQPRMKSISRWDTSVAEIEKWAYEVASPRADLAWAGVGPQVAGEHCRWCRVKARCSAWNKMNLDLARFNFAEPSLLSVEELTEVFEAIPRIAGWTDTVKAYLTEQAKLGRNIPGFKIVEGYSRRKWRNADDVIETLEMMGFDDYTTTKIKGIGAIEGMMSVDQFNALLGPDVIKPKGKPTLVPMDDSRPAISNADDARAAFADLDD